MSRNDLILLTIGDMTGPAARRQHRRTGGGGRGGRRGGAVHRCRRPAPRPPDQPPRCRPAARSVVQGAQCGVRSGGANKTHAIAAVLRSGLGSALVCDEATARAAMEIALGAG